MAMNGVGSASYSLTMCSSKRNLPSLWADGCEQDWSCIEHVQALCLKAWNHVNCRVTRFTGSTPLLRFIPVNLIHVIQSHYNTTITCSTSWLPSGGLESRPVIIALWRARTAVLRSSHLTSKRNFQKTLSRFVPNRYFQACHLGLPAQCNSQ